MIGKIRKFRDIAGLSSAAAQDISDIINEAVSLKGVFYLALSGGDTPRTLYHIFGTTFSKLIPWESVHIFFCDERYVPHEDGQSNYKMVKEELLDAISIPQKNIHPVPTNRLNPAEAAQDYEKELKKYFSPDGTSFDLALLGMGKEGHTASLFPASQALDEKKKWAAAVEAPATPSRRVTLTFPILNRAAEVYFIISGSGKAQALTEVITKDSDFHIRPAAGVMPTSGKLVWWIDQSTVAT